MNFQFKLFILLSFSTYIISGSYRNVCKTYTDYYLMMIGLGSSCYHSDDLFANTTQVLKNHNKSFETHEVVTDDGYILTVFRIPRIKNPKGVVLLHHPAVSDSVAWVGQGNDSLAFILWEAGYDVWLPNNRGTYFSNKHRTLSSKSEKYWDFTYHELGVYDLPASINYILPKTNHSKLIVIGHSMAAPASLAFASLYPDAAKNSIKVFIQMAPACYFKYMRSPVKYFATFRNHIKTLIRMKYGSMRFFKVLVYLPFKKLLVILISLTAGWTPNEFDPTYVNAALSQNPRGGSWKSWQHFAQQLHAGGNYQMFDYGAEKNLQLYNQSTPPEYPVGRINVPVYLVYSTDDICVTDEDAELLYKKMSNEARIYGKLKVKGLNHIDYIYGKHRKELLYDQFFKLLEKIT